MHCILLQYNVILAPKASKAIYCIGVINYIMIYNYKWHQISTQNKSITFWKIEIDEV